MKRTTRNVAERGQNVRGIISGQTNLRECLIAEEQHASVATSAEADRGGCERTDRAVNLADPLRGIVTGKFAKRHVNFGKRRLQGCFRAAARGSVEFFFEDGCEEVGNVRAVLAGVIDTKKTDE